MTKRYVLTGIALIGFLAAAVFLVKKNRPVAVLPTVNVVTSENSSGPKARGTENAPILIEEYSDFQCPACQKAEPILTGILRDYPGKVQIVFHHFPLPGHKWSGISHQSAECANKFGHF